MLVSTSVPLQGEYHWCLGMGESQVAGLCVECKRRLQKAAQSTCGLLSKLVYLLVGNKLLLNEFATELEWSGWEGTAQMS